MQELLYKKPKNMEALLNNINNGKSKIIAGGTDVIPRINKGLFADETLVDISEFKELNFIKIDESDISIGSLVSYNDIETHTVLSSVCPILNTASAVVGSYQTRQRGTIGGSIGNASPAGDILAPLMALDAKVNLISVDGNRDLPITQLFISPGKTKIQANEIIHHIHFKKLPQGTKYYYFKQGKRNAMACSVVNCAIVAVVDGENRFQDVRIALGSVAPKPIRCYETEILLRNQQISDKLIEDASVCAASEASPICDVRASGDYRSHLIRQLIISGLNSFK
ncbi:MAG: xanthine dehydrogenase family protein subunit M [Anaerolineaceae bacterium]|nr:xanthine dehydrogenase family protein subunit M [Anaerolineaceae bacterium]